MRVNGKNDIPYMMENNPFISETTNQINTVFMVLIILVFFGQMEVGQLVVDHLDDHWTTRSLQSAIGQWQGSDPPDPKLKQTSMIFHLGLLN